MFEKATWQCPHWNGSRSVATSKAERFLHPTIAIDGFLSRPVFAFFYCFLFFLLCLRFFSFSFDLYLVKGILDEKRTKVETTSTRPSVS
jgi:hypothetical protein